jgi:hypothetical protein
VARHVLSDSRELELSDIPARQVECRYARDSAHYKLPPQRARLAKVAAAFSRSNWLTQHGLTYRQLRAMRCIHLPSNCPSTLFKMRLLSLLSLLSPLLPTALAATAASSTLTLQAWPLSSPSPVPIASISLSQASAIINDFTPLAPSKNAKDLVRIGVLDASGKWHGSAAPATFFSSSVDRIIILHVDDKGEVYHVGVGTTEVENPLIAFERERKEKKKDKKDKNAIKLKKSDVKKREGTTTVEVKRTDKAALPVLNKPIVLNAEGKLEGQGEEEKSFLQK